jgi:hypothetical protein
MADIERISVDDAHREVDANRALLVCAYDDEAKCRMVGDTAGAQTRRRARRLTLRLHKDGDDLALVSRGDPDGVRCRSGEPCRRPCAMGYTKRHLHGAASPGAKVAEGS